ncbi:MAG: ferrous iron transport protein B [Armatimonadetes bacterium]|nr:ferrous iron transport protein B [Armatimonadota bacterium]
MSALAAVPTPSAGTARARLIALVGNPNCGKTALFNALTGSRQKVANYPGVTVERKEGAASLPSGERLRVIDLPGAYSLRPRSPDEAVTRDVVLGRGALEDLPDAIVCVVDATNLHLNLRLLLELKTVRRPIVLAVNMMDLAARWGYDLDLTALAADLGIPVVATVAIRSDGVDVLLGALERVLHAPPPAPLDEWREATPLQIRSWVREVDRIVAASTRTNGTLPAVTRKVDRLLLHPVLGLFILASLFFFIFQALYSWAAAPQELLEQGVAALAQLVGGALPEGPLRSLLVDGIIAGVGSVLVFVPQILILFFFILLLEDSGYMARAAFLMDRLMGSVGLHGRAFIPLLSSFACAIPGIMATRTIENPRDRLATILIAPLITCSARLPVYALIIAAFIPAQTAVGPFGLQGLVLFGLYLAGIVSALLVAFVLKRTLCKGPQPPLLMEMPSYKVPSARSLFLGLLDRFVIFVRRAGTIILSVMVILWFLSSYPAPPPNPTMPAIDYSFAGMLGRTLEPVFRPVGFNSQICIALVPGLAAREVAVAALGTVYAVEAGDESGVQTLTMTLAKSWSLATGLSFLVWYIFAPQCISTLVVTRRETNSWKWPAVMFGYMFALAYAASFVTYHATLWLGG